ncbi:hypothetical protein Tco_0178818 [Tanacetum coccineum]
MAGGGKWDRKDGSVWGPRKWGRNRNGQLGWRVREEPEDNRRYWERGNRGEDLQDGDGGSWEGVRGGSEGGWRDRIPLPRKGGMELEVLDGSWGGMDRGRSIHLRKGIAGGETGRGEGGGKVMGIGGGREVGMDLYIGKGCRTTTGGSGGMEGCGRGESGRTGIGPYPPNPTSKGGSEWRVGKVIFIMEKIDKFLEHDDSIPPGVDGIYDSEGDTVYLEELLSVINSDPNLPPSPVCEINVPEEIKSSCEDPPDLELKDLPSHLEYAFLEGDDKLPIIIAKNLKDEDKPPF